MGKVVRKRALTARYVSPNQLVLEGFKTPFDQQLTRANRWVKLSEAIPWDSIVSLYEAQFKSTEGRPPINGRVILGAVIIKHMLDLTDRETVSQLTENMFMQYFLGYAGFTNEEPFSPSLFTEIRERLTLNLMNAINEIIVAHSLLTDKESPPKERPKNKNKGTEETVAAPKESPTPPSAQEPTAHKGKLIMDATAAPQNITYPTDTKVLNAAREKSEELIDKLWDKQLHGPVKVRTYREIARKDFLHIAQKKSKSSQAIYKANGSLLRYLKRNLGHIKQLMESYAAAGEKIPWRKKDYNYHEVIEKVYEQQEHMHSHRIHQVENRIVNIHQAHVRPIVRGKEGKKVEFGSKQQTSLVDGFTFLDRLSWDNFNEGTYLRESVEKYKRRFGHYPQQVLADKIYCTQENRRFLKEKKIVLRAKPLGRPPSVKAVEHHVSPGERNPIEGKFGQAKMAYGLGCIRAKLKTTSESWIASIILVLNLKNLMRRALPWLLFLRYYFQVWLSCPREFMSKP